jgi:hypothetical protein
MMNAHFLEKFHTIVSTIEHYGGDVGIDTSLVQTEL